MKSETAGEQFQAMASTAGYGEAAKALAEQYESVTFTEVHREVLHLFPSRPSSVLDIGAGSGRDAAALAAQGHQVVAGEPTAGLRSLGRRIHADGQIGRVDDALPELPLQCAQRRRFDLIVLTAVWMHLDERQRALAMAHLVGLFEPGGTRDPFPAPWPGPGGPPHVLRIRAGDHRPGPEVRAGCCPSRRARGPAWRPGSGLDLPRPERGAAGGTCA
ncbi:methyltransferase domain-containing protein [Streptomyces sp. NPDC004533]|uniref:class I SAM-dependent methyltransferase n=1 Tax=Streptomyces sp. NPDC004533 TaxID=3154278 RepID=UPI0033A7B684